MVELVYLFILDLDNAVLALSNLLAVFNTFLRTIFASTACAVVAMIANDEEPFKLLVAQLAVGLVLLRSLHRIAKTHCGNHSWIERINVLLRRLLLLGTLGRLLLLLIILMLGCCRTDSPIVKWVLLILVRENGSKSRLSLPEESTDLFCAAILLSLELRVLNLLLQGCLMLFG